MKRLFVTLLTIALIVGGTYLGITFLQANKPEAKKRELVQTTPTVEVTKVTPAAADITIKSEGSVYARRETIVAAEIAGRITQLHPNFEPGGTFREGELIALLDPLNYEAAVSQAEGVLAEAQLQIELEKARAQQALRDWKKIGRGKEPTALVLRTPYLKRAEAGLKSAQAALERANEDLARTQIKAPFDCRVRATNLDVGATVAPGAALGTVYDPTDFLVRLALSLDDYALLPEEPKITVSAQIGGRRYRWQAETLWTEGELDRETLSSNFLAKILPNEENGARFRFPPAGLFVEAEVEGVTLENVLKVPRSAVRGEREVSVLTEESLLAFRELEIVRRDREYVYASGELQPGDRLILTKMELPVVGMKLAVAESKGGPE